MRAAAFRARMAAVGDALDVTARHQRRGHEDVQVQQPEEQVAEGPWAEALRRGSVRVGPDFRGFDI